MAEKEIDKFIVVKRKDFEDLKEKAISEFASLHLTRSKTILKEIQGFETIVRQLSNGKCYIVFNQDEPYANALWDIIIAFEDSKELLANAVLGKKGASR